jgi:lipopolysaccharide transport system ATP-binding protein
MTWAVQFEDVSKRYVQSGAPDRSLREALTRLGQRAVGFHRDQAVRPPVAPALQHVSFDVKEGEAFALIGPNGAGKTTALKLIARIASPTRGRIRVRGRVGALIEVGGGIHPDLTGRENIWLYGRVMGVSRGEISRRFDDIVDFAGLAHVIDRPVKTYSTGMQLRLGFSVASHVNCEIFIVDEALAVGDAVFQARCVERMMGLVHSGTTLLFVSHQLTAVESVCGRGVFLLDGRVADIGNIKDVLRKYLDWTEERRLERYRGRELVRDSNAVVEIVGATCHSANGHEQYGFAHDEPVEIRVCLRTRVPIRNPQINVGITDGRPQLLVLCSTLHKGNPPDHVTGEWLVSCRIERLNLMPRLYHVWFDVYTEHGHVARLCEWQEVTRFRVIGTDVTPIEGKSAITLEALYGAVRTDYQWTYDVKKAALGADPSLPSGPAA